MVLSILVAQMVQLRLYRGLQTGLHDRHAQVWWSWGWALLPECSQALASGSCPQPDGSLNFNKATPRVTRNPLPWIPIVTMERHSSLCSVPVPSPLLEFSKQHLKRPCGQCKPSHLPAPNPVAVSLESMIYQAQVPPFPTYRV